MEGLNPISRSWSASSSTSTFKDAHRGARLLVWKWSMSRPGVATRKSHAWLFILLRSELMFVPPNTTCAFRLWNVNSDLASSWIWLASSRVGESTRHETAPRAAGPALIIVSIEGSRNATVLPEPVLALARTSKPRRIGGSVWSCTVVACVNFMISLMARIDGAESPSAENAVVLVLLSCCFSTT